MCAGPGGVGKTTISAALALGMAERGSKVAVVTIDPARRLADALGHKTLGNEPQRVANERLEAAGLEVKGELWAMMLDPKRTFDELVTQLAPDEQTRDAVLGNRIYQQLSGTIAGTQEFAAIEKLYELECRDEFDLIVLDTPPSRHALDFLDAPDRLGRFLSGRALSALLRPSGIGMKLLGRGSGLLSGTIGRITGVDLLSDLSVFFRTLGHMTEAFSQRAHRVKRLLGAQTTTTLLITSPEHGPVREMESLAQELARRKITVAAAVLNRAHHDVIDTKGLTTNRKQLAAVLDPELARRVADNLTDYHVLAERDRATAKAVAKRFPKLPLIEIPYFDDDVHDIAGLQRTLRYLFASASERSALLRRTVA